MTDLHEVRRERSRRGCCSSCRRQPSVGEPEKVPLLEAQPDDVADRVEQEDGQHDEHRQDERVARNIAANVTAAKSPSRRLVPRRSGVVRMSAVATHLAVSPRLRLGRRPGGIVPTRLHAANEVVRTLLRSYEFLRAVTAFAAASREAWTSAPLAHDRIPSLARRKRPGRRRTGAALSGPRRREPG